MEFNKATYSYNKLDTCVCAIKSFPFRCEHKGDHCLELYNKLKNLYDLCYTMTDCLLFNVDWVEYLQMYLNALAKKSTKKELDKILRFNEMYIKNQV